MTALTQVIDVDEVGKFPETIQIGYMPTLYQLKNELKKKNMRITPDADKMLENTNFKFAFEEQPVDLVTVTAKELELPEEYRLVDVISAGAARGFKLSPPETGPMLRLQYPDQEIRTGFIVLSNIYLDCDRTKVGMFHVWCTKDGDLYLDVVKVNLNELYLGASMFVFEKPRF